MCDEIQAQIGTGPSIYNLLCQQRGGWLGSEKWQFLLIFSTIYADLDWCVGRGPKKDQKHADVIYEWPHIQNNYQSSSLLMRTISGIERIR